MSRINGGTSVLRPNGSDAVIKTRANRDCSSSVPIIRVTRACRSVSGPQASVFRSVTADPCSSESGNCTQRKLRTGTAAMIQYSSMPTSCPNSSPGPTCEPTLTERSKICASNGARTRVLSRSSFARFTAALAALTCDLMDANCGTRNTNSRFESSIESPKRANSVLAKLCRPSSISSDASAWASSLSRIDTAFSKSAGSICSSMSPSLTIPPGTNSGDSSTTCPRTRGLSTIS